MTDTPLTPELIDHVLENLDPGTLSEWEQSFLTSVKAYWKRSRKLSAKQQKRLGELWESRFDAKRVYKKGDRP